MKTDLQKRVEAIREEAELAFWAKVAELSPSATSGDFPPDLTFQMHEEMDHWIKTWLFYNDPTYLEVDSPQWFTRIAQFLVQLGFEAEAENTGGGIICIGVSVGKYRLLFGTANENWGFDVYDLGSEWGFNDDLTNEYGLNPATQMTLPTAEENPEKCAVAIANVVDIFKKDREASEVKIQLGVRVL